MEWTDTNFAQHPALNVFGTVVANPDGSTTTRKSFVRWRFDVRNDAAFAAIVKEANQRHRKGEGYTAREFVYRCWNELLVERVKPHIDDIVVSGKSGSAKPVKLSQYNALTVKWDANVHRANRFFWFGVHGNDDKRLFATEAMTDSELFSGHPWWDFPEQVAYELIAGRVFAALNGFLKDYQEAMNIRRNNGEKVPSEAELAKASTVKAMFGFRKETIKPAPKPKKTAVQFADELGLDFGL